MDLARAVFAHQLHILLLGHEELELASVDTVLVGSLRRVDCLCILNSLLFGTRLLFLSHGINVRVEPLIDLLQLDLL